MEKPQPATDKVHEATCTFERPVVFDNGEGKTSTNFIDLYKNDCFVLEAKQGAEKAEVTEAELLRAEKVLQTLYGLGLLRKTEQEQYVN